MLQTELYPTHDFDPAKPYMTPSEKAKARKAHFAQMQVVADWREAMRILDAEPWLSFDLETSGLSPRRDRIAVVALYGPERNVAGILHFAGRPIPDELLAWLGSPQRRLVGHNVTRFDELFLDSYGLNIRAPHWYDTLIGEQVATQSDRKGVRMNLKELLERKLGVTIPKDVDHGTWMLPTLTDEQLRYVADDIYYVPRLMQDQWRRAAESDEKWQHPGELGVRDAMLFEQALGPVCAQMMAKGLPINVKALVDYTRQQHEALPEHEAWLLAHLGPAWAELYPKDAGVLLGSYTKLPAAINLAFGTQLSDTKADTLKMLREGEGALAEMAERMLRWRHGTKREAMYDENFIEAYVDDGRLYGQFTQCGTATGRFSSWQPNLQQLPRDMRYVIDGSHTGETVVAADYAAIEVCVAADLYQDPELLEAVKAEDIHSEVASMIFGSAFTELALDDPKRKELRRLAKAGSFNLTFGGGFATLHAKARADGSQASYQEVKGAGERFLGRFQGVARARGKAYAMADQGRPVPIKFPTGLRRVLQPNVDLKGTTILNNSVQGTAAAGLKRALMLLDERGLSQYLCAVVHDEIVTAVPDALAAEVASELREAMVEGMQSVTDATVRVDLKVGKQWQ
jgi:DNA polymerase I-like protein with 3'-5' exonuclease and polymerase domains